MNPVKMWSLLAALATLAVLVNSECLPSFEPRNKSTHRLDTSGQPLTWLSARAKCQQVAPGLGLLGRDFLYMDEGDKRKCANHEVPLGLWSTSTGNIVWVNATCLWCNDTNVDVNAKFLRLQQRDKRTRTPVPYQVGSLNLTTGKWRLVSNNSTFECILCQRARIGWLGQFDVDVPQRQNKVYTFQTTKTGVDNDTIAAAIRVAQGYTNRSQDGVDVDTFRSDTNGTVFRVKMADTLDVSNVTLAIVGSWRDLDWCPSERFRGFEWLPCKVGTTQEIRQEGFKVVTRKCVTTPTVNDDFDAVWEDAVTFWTDRGAECKTRPLENALRTLERLVAWPPLDPKTAITKLVNITTVIPRLEWPLTNREAFYPLKRNISQGILGALTNLLIATLEDPEVTGDQCTGNTCVFLTGDIQKTNASSAVIFHDSGRPSFAPFGTMTPAVISLRLPDEPSRPGRVAIHTFMAHNLNKAPLFQPTHDLAVKASTGVFVHVASTIAFNTWPLTFEVEHAGSKNTCQTYLATWNVGETEESTMPCPLTKATDSVDTFQCKFLETSNVENITVGMFVVFHGVAVPDTNLERFVYRLLDRYGNIEGDTLTLQAAVTLISLLIDNGTSVMTSLTDGSLSRILDGVMLDDPVVIANQRHVKALIADLNVTDPVVGFSVSRKGTMQSVTSASRNLSTTSAFDIVLGVDVERQFERLEILTLTKSKVDHLSKRPWLMAISLAVKSLETPTDPVYFDIHLNASAVRLGGGDHRLLVATWSDQVKHWSVTSCSKLRATRGAKQVFRCEFDTLGGKYLVFEPVGFTEAFGIPLLAVLIAAGLLSGISLASIAITAAAIPAWRQDLGHKILLHMALALSFNLALGFASSMFSVDTTSVACVAIGALRHFSYLAMFAWMLVMSGLQLRRLLSVLGARDTANLLLKVSICAWGVPTLVVGLLLYFKTDLYQSDAVDRGYCYPEGTAFTWLVQAPAATVLALNVVIFAVILARIYSFLGWGKTEELRRHLDERTFQMRRLRAVFFTFSLFGITWVFHLLADKGVFQEKFLYEYLFLVTASVHVFSLSCVFVFLEKDTRVEMCKLAKLLRGDVSRFCARVVRGCGAAQAWTCALWVGLKKTEESPSELEGVIRGRVADVKGAGKQS